MREFFKTNSWYIPSPSLNMKKYLIIAVLSAIGIFNAFYLSIPAYKFWNGADSAALQMMPCDVSDKLSCSGILQNPRAIIFSVWDFKVAFPMIAAIVYPVLFLIALWGWFSKTMLPAKILTAMAAGGMMFNSYVIYQEFIVWVFCPLCAMCTVIIVTIFILSILIWKWAHTPKVEKIVA
jgi:uncharacterized membrane protein